MKKYIYHIFTALSALLLLASCQQEEEIVFQKPTLKVVSSDVIFGVEGGQGTIVVQADAAVSVTSERPWVQTSVSGNTITVTVTETNLSHMSRYSRLTITDGSSETYVTVHQYGEIFDGLALEDGTVPKEGATMIFKYLSNLPVQMSADVDWVHFEAVEDEKEGKLMKITFDANPGLTRFAHVSFTAGTNSGTAEFIQWPTPTQVTAGWDVSITDGVYDFPNQIDQVTLTVPNESQLYEFQLVGKEVIKDDSKMGEKAMEIAADTWAELKAAMEQGTVHSPGEFLMAGLFSEQLENLPRSIWAIVILYDDRGIPTGEYYYKDLQVPDRGPVKQVVDGWDITHSDGTYVHPTQTDEFTITPKAGYEDVKYIATLVKKSDVADVEDYAFTNFAMSTREEILAKVASGELPSFEAGLRSGTTTISVDDTLGDVYIVVVAFGDNKFYTGDYQFAEFTLVDLQPAYYKWVGTWTVSGKTMGGVDVTEDWTISIDEDDTALSTLTIRGMNSHTTASIVAADGDKMKLDYDKETGAIKLYGQNGTNTFTYSSYGTCYLSVQPQYTKNGGESFTRVTGSPLVFTAVFNEAGEVEMTPGTRTTGGVTYPYVQFRLYLITEENKTYSLGATSGSVPLPLNMVRK